MTQLTLPAGSALDIAFEEFHTAHPEVMAELVQLAYDWQARKRERAGIGMFWEVLRWQRSLRLSGTPKLNNSLRSRYARRLMVEHPDLADLFETRELRS